MCTVNDCLSFVLYYNSTGYLSGVYPTIYLLKRLNMVIQVQTDKQLMTKQPESVVFNKLQMKTVVIDAAIQTNCNIKWKPKK